MDSPCIWMSAGLVRYKLCDRDFDCEHCPLDAALRGESSWPGPAPADAPRALDFPPDRRYSPGHLWVAPRPHGEVGTGVDAVAAALLGTARGVRWSACGRVQRGEVVATLDLPYGLLPIAAPVGGRRFHGNEALDRAPSLLASDPYGEGWLFAMAGAGDDGLLDPAAAAAQARLDLRHFRRRAALLLLAEASALGATLPDGGEALTDLRHMLGPRRYLELVRELVH
ncbi:MAG TPA: glycine cleavage system protein H [Vicinamibacteria bacterium]|nr:glycine cleavage system protein H [Vicinamibacteria bacterium]